MRQSLISSVLFLTLAVIASAHGDREQEIVDLEARRSAAIAAHDEKFLDALYDDQFAGFATNGRRVDKKAMLAVFKRDDATTKFTREETAVRILGDVALSTGRLRGVMPSGQVVVDSWYTHVYHWRDGRWKLVAAQGTPVRP